MVPKHQTIDAIRKLNPTARPEFLAEFPNDELDRYLDRLHHQVLCDARAPADDAAILGAPEAGRFPDGNETELF